MSKILPRFLYHLTSKAKYESIMASGVLRKSKPEDLCSEGVYMMELTNFFKRWGHDKAWDNMNLREQLVARTSAGDMVILRIPTKEINTDKLRIRSQNRLCPEVKSMHAQRDKKVEEVVNAQSAYLRAEFEKIDKSLPQEEQLKILEAIQDEASKKFQIPDFSEFISPFGHTIKGSPAKLRKLFQQRKEAIEYIYPDDIPASQIEKIGEVDVFEIMGEAIRDIAIGSESHYPNEIRKIFATLLKGAPEEKSLHLLDCNC